jgi:sugar fermentation stimulation protein A
LAAYILFVIQMKGVHSFRPNHTTHQAFGDALREAQEAGVHVLAVDCRVTPEAVTADGYIPVNLSEGNL